MSDSARDASDGPVLARVRELVLPIASDLGLDLYDVEQRGGTLRITLDTPAGSGNGVTLDTLLLASRLVSKELDQHDPIPSRYTLEVTSPGVERALRRPEHFRREVGKVIAIRLTGIARSEPDSSPRAEPGSTAAAERRVQGTIVAADDSGVTLALPEGERTIAYGQIDRARTVFEWGPQPKPGHGQARKPAPSESAARPDASPGEGEGES